MAGTVDLTVGNRTDEATLVGADGGESLELAFFRLRDNDLRVGIDLSTADGNISCAAKIGSCRCGRR